MHTIYHNQLPDLIEHFLGFAHFTEEMTHDRFTVQTEEVDGIGILCCIKPEIQRQYDRFAVVFTKVLDVHGSEKFFDPVGSNHSGMPVVHVVLCHHKFRYMVDFNQRIEAAQSVSLVAGEIRGDIGNVRQIPFVILLQKIRDLTIRIRFDDLGTLLVEFDLQALFDKVVPDETELQNFGIRKIPKFIFYAWSKYHIELIAFAIVLGFRHDHRRTGHINIKRVEIIKSDHSISHPFIVVVWLRYTDVPRPSFSPEGPSVATSEAIWPKTL